MTKRALAELGTRTTAAQALEVFDGLAAVRAEDLTGRWRGHEVSTGHPLDGLLEPTGWYGKEFNDVDHVHPLLFRAANGEIYPADPSRMPLKAAGRAPATIVERARPIATRMRPFVQASSHTARLRNMEHRGVVTAAMIYDDLPIIDVFRRADDRTLLGVMDYRAHPEPYFFVLERD